MRVVIDARESGTSTGRYVDKLIEHLHKLKPDFEFLVLTKKNRLDFIKAIAPSFQVVESNVKEFSFAEQLDLKKQIVALKPDLVHFAMPQQPILYSGRTVTTIHDLTTVRFNNPAKHLVTFKFKQQVYKFVLKQVAKKSRRLIAISQYTKDDFINFTHINPDKISVVYEAADKITTKPEAISELSGKSFILFVGRPNPHKNLQRLIEAMEQVRQKDPQLTLVLAGKIDQNYTLLKKFVTDKNLTDQVFFTDFVSDAQLRWLYENARAYVFPSLSEGFGLPGLEAMCYSLPLISSNATCLPEIYGDAAIYFDPLDVKDIADKIVAVCSDSKLRSDLTGKEKALIRKYSWSKTARQTLEVYEAALS